MLLTLSTTSAGAGPATDLGYLLHKHPDRAQAFDVSMGTAHVFYPAAGAEECTAALLLEIDPVTLARRGRNGDAGATLGQYVNDQPYAAGSMLAVALSAVFSSAMKGRCQARPELPETTFPLTVRVPTLTCRGDADLVPRLFEPLGWTVHTAPVPLDPEVPAWGDSRFLNTTLTGRMRVADALTHLYVLLPVLAGAKHYWVGADEVDKLLRAGNAWLAGHPERELISQRYLAHRRAYVRSALERLAEADDADVDALDNALAEPVNPEPGNPEPATADRAGGTGAVGGADPADRPLPLAAQRRGTVRTLLRSAGAHRVLDLGCGGGALLRELLAEPTFTELVGVDVSAGALAVAERRLRLDRPPARDRVTLRQSALTYTDASLTGYDAAVLMEVVEHVDLDRLPALEHAVFGNAHPGTVLVTTPNVEHNVRFAGLEPGRMRHADHRFEWTRAEFRNWAQGVAERQGYAVRFLAVGPDDPEVGPPTQVAVFDVASDNHPSGEVP